MACAKHRPARHRAPDLPPRWARVRAAGRRPGAGVAGGGPHVGDHVRQPGGGEGHDLVTRPVVERQHVGHRVMDPAVGEHDLVHVPVDLVRGGRTHDPLVRPVEDDPRVVEVQEREPDAVDRAGRGGMDAVVAEQPALRRLQRRRPEPDLAGVPPCPVARLEEEAVVAPVAEVRGIRDPDVGVAPQRGGPVEHRPAAVEPAREDRRVLVLRRHDRAFAADVTEVARHGQRHEGTPVAIGRVGDRPVLELRQPGEPRILAAPDLLRVALRLRLKQRLCVDAPVRGAIAAACHHEVRDPPHVLDADEEHGVVADPGRARVEDRVGAVGQIRDGDQGVGGMAPEQDVLVAVIGIHERHPLPAGTASALSRAASGGIMGM